ncbi:MAG: hypothetical protein HYX86_03410 [Chloroflexi bacterium]|nr:hypothetical protein [Chloroflexota bacterium]
MTANAKLFAEMAVVIALALGSLLFVGTNPDLRARISTAAEDVAARIEATLGLKANIDYGERAPEEDQGLLNWQLRAEDQTSAGGQAEGQGQTETDFLARLRAVWDGFWLQIRIMLGLNASA